MSERRPQDLEWEGFRDSVVARSWRRFFRTLFWFYLLALLPICYNLPPDCRLVVLVTRLSVMALLAQLMRALSSKPTPWRLLFLLVTALTMTGNLHWNRMGGPNLILELTYAGILLTGLLEINYRWAGLLFCGLVSLGVTFQSIMLARFTLQPIPFIVAMSALAFRHSNLRSRFLLYQQGRRLQGQLEIALDSVAACNSELDRRIQERAESLRRTSASLEAAHIKLRRDQEQQLELQKRWFQSQRLATLGRFASGLSEEFMRGLTVIQNALVPVRQAVEDPRERDLLDEIEKAVERGARLTERFLLTSGSVPSQDRLVELSAWAAECVKSLKPRLPREICLNSPPEASIWVLADLAQLDQILANLVFNACDASPRGAQVQVSVGITDGNASLTVTDQGEGISAQIQERIFEPFFTTKALGHGFGLGLAIVEQLARRQGGECQVRSAPGQGSTFQVLLPLAQPDH